MTEMAQGSALDFAESSSPVQIAPVAPQQDVSERVFKQQEVNDIVKREKHAAIESFKRMALEQPQYLQQKHPDLAPLVGQHQTQNYSNANAFNQDDIRRMAAEEAQRLRNEWINDSHRTAQEQEAKRIADDFLAKLTTGKTRYDNFDKVMENIEFSQFGSAVQLANMFDNTADVWYYLADNPMQLEAVNNLAAKNSKTAYIAMEKLSKQLKDNEAAQNIKLPNAPLSQVRPSNNGTSSGELTVDDYRRKYKGMKF